MACCGMAFFLFAYQVHEKSILLPLLPVTLLAPDMPRFAAWLPPLAALSMYPLLKRDGLQAAYFACLTLWLLLASCDWQLVSWPKGKTVAHKQPSSARNIATFSSRSSSRGVATSDKSGSGRSLWLLLRQCTFVLQTTSLGVAAAVHLVAACTVPPKRLPFLHDAAFTGSSFVFLITLAVALNVMAYYPALQKL
jgi:alpha-1,3-glucosyltransferase